MIVGVISVNKNGGLEELTYLTEEPRGSMTLYKDIDADFPIVRVEMALKLYGFVACFARLLVVANTVLIVCGPPAAPHYPEREPFSQSA